MSSFLHKSVCTLARRKSEFPLLIVLPFCRFKKSLISVELVSGACSKTLAKDIVFEQKTVFRPFEIVPKSSRVVFLSSDVNFISQKFVVNEEEEIESPGGIPKEKNPRDWRDNTSGD